MAQVFSLPSVSQGMEALQPLRPTALKSVKCLECSEEYAKPTRGGTLATNPGCPHCGYVGWSPAYVSLSAARPRDRFAAGRRRRLIATAS